MTPAPIKQWHAYMDTLDAATLKDLLTEDVVFESPVVHTPQAGRSITEIALARGFNSLPHFSRVFAQRFGVPPSVCRRGAEGAAGR